MIKREYADRLGQLIQNIDSNSRRINISTHRLSNGNVAIFRTSKPFERENYTEFFYGVHKQNLLKQGVKNVFILFVCGRIEEIVVIPAKIISDLLSDVGPSKAGEHKVHIYESSSTYKILVTGKPRVDVSSYLNNFGLLTANPDDLGIVSDPDQVLFPEEIIEAKKIYEGAVRQILINAYERDPEARKRCIAHYGSRCIICAFDFGIIYGKHGDGYIQVHHLRALSEIGKAYEVDPISDLRPVCPNCHAMIHRRVPAHSIDEVKTMLRTAQNQLVALDEDF
mgnify:CR=1 FL=1